MPKGTGGSGAKNRATSRGKIHDVFFKRLEDLGQQAREQYQAYVGNGVRPWQVPSDFETDLRDIPNLHKPSYDRSELNTNYLECVQDATDAGRNGDVISLKHQIAWVATQERAFRYRHATITRCIAHAMGRRYGHGHGPLFELVRTEAEELLKTGGA